MIERSFVFLEGVGRKTEEKLWKADVKDWNEFLNREKIKGLSKTRKYYYDRQLMQAKKALQKQDLSFFLHKLPLKEHWRLYELFKSECVFLDIEVDGKGKITVMTLFDGFETKTMVRGVNLEKEIFENEIGKYKLLITYNGSAFDMPKIEKEFKIKVRMPHVDLKPLCLRLGLKGGLKEIERQLGIPRPQHLRGHAVDAWKAFWASGDKEWLELLVKYNEEDAVNLKQLVEKCIGKLRVLYCL